MASSRPELREPDKDLIEFLSQVLADVHLDAAIIGGMARNHWARARMTFDVDFTVVADAVGEQALAAALTAAGFVVMREQRPRAPSGPDFVQFYNPGNQHMVEFQAAKTPFQELLIRRAVPIGGPGSLRVATREDLIVLKLIAFRDKDQDDLRELAVADGLDWSYVEQWAEEWDVRERLARLRAWLDERAVGGE